MDMGHLVSLQPTVVDNRTATDRFNDNLSVKLKSASFWVASVGGALVTILLAQWQSLDAGQQGALLNSLGLSKVWVPSAVLLVGYLGAALKPARAGTLSPQAAALAEQLSREQLNAALRRHGQAELPPPTNAPTVTTRPPIIVVGAGPAQPAAVAPTPMAQPAEAPVTAPADPPPFADTQQVDLLLPLGKQQGELPLPLNKPATSPPSVLAKALLAAQREGLLAGARILAPGLSDDQIAAALTRAVAQTQSEIPPPTPTKD